MTMSGRYTLKIKYRFEVLVPKHQILHIVQ